MARKKYECKTASCRAQRMKFKRTNKECRKGDPAMSEYSACMSAKLSTGGSKKSKKKSTMAKKCAGLYTGGKKKGKLKPGFKYAGKGKCPVKVKSK